MFKLFPQQKQFFDLFETQAHTILDCLPILLEIQSAARIDPLWTPRIKEIEERGDALTKQIIETAEQTFITPIDREDIYVLAKAIDDVMDFTEEAVAKIVAYHLLPDTILQDFLQTLRISIIHVHEGVLCLRKLSDLNKLKLQEKIKECEHAADRLEAIVIAESHEIIISDILPGKNDHEAITVGDLRKIFDVLMSKQKRQEIAELFEAAVDASEKVFHILGNIYLKWA